MSNASPVPSAVISTKWTVIRGPMTGSVRLMNLTQFTVGRSPDCEFVIVNDPKCSRQHAQVHCNSGGCEVISLNDRNLVLVNGTPVQRGILSDGDVITFGETEVQFNAIHPGMVTDGGEPHPKLSLVRVGSVSISSLAPSGTPGYVQQTTENEESRIAPGGVPSSRRKRSSRKKEGLGRLWLYGPLALIVLLFLLPSKVKKKDVQIRNEQQIQADIETAKKLREASEAEAMKRLDQNVTARQAQENYVRGFRDYKKGQFERALMSFQACLALNPEHVKCNRYVRMSKRKFDELVQYEIVQGRKFRDQGQYKACRAAFRNVMVMVKDANSPIYQEAQANYDACDALIEGRF